MLRTFEPKVLKRLILPIILKSKNMELQEAINYVKTFHESFGINNENSPKIDVGESVIKLRHSLMHEENEEYLEAAEAGDLVEVADALGDMLYILCGTILAHGLQHKIEEVFTEIQRSNMSKLGADGKPIYREDGKVMKGENYFKPNIKEVLEGRK
jgi:predicted HAD superfamily Cof-like phosphohydrolase